MNYLSKLSLAALVALVLVPVGCGDPCLDDGFGALGQECDAVVSAGGTDSNTDGPTATMGDSTADDSEDTTMGGSGGGSGGQESFCRDADGDGFADLDDCMDGDPNNPPPGHIPAGGEDDCDDGNSNTFPGAAELEDPNACMNDDDDDGWGDDDVGPGVDPGSDCDDTNDATFPGSAENEDPNACTNDDDDDGWGDADPGPGIDPGSDCDDEDAGAGECDTLWCVDADGDGAGDPDDCEPGTAGDPPSDDHVPNADDCDDGDDQVFPGAAMNEPEICTRDEDGDGWGDADPGPGIDPGSDCVDDNPNIFPGAAANEPMLCTIDLDGDGWGDANASSIDPAAEDGSDCDDSSVFTFPGASQNEAPPLDAECTRDVDDDGFGDDSPPGGVVPGTDCADSNADIFPGAAASEPNLCTRDVDGDGFGDANASTIDPGADDGTDCNDNDLNTFPGASENEAPPLDMACTTDADGDGFGEDTPGPGVTPGTDCDDADVAVTMCDIWCLDSDMDTFGDPNDCVASPVQPSPNHVMNAGDCDDSSGFTFPGASQNEAPPLDAACTRDEDDDGFGDDTPPAGVTPGTDCVDTDATVFPGAAAAEAGLCTIDVDGDGFGDADASTTFPGADNGTDCVDDNPNIRPGAAINEPALCTIDVDGDGWGDDGASGIDPDAENGSDCDDSVATVAPGVAANEPELCTIDADGDGWGDWDAPSVNPNAEEGSDCDDAVVAIERCALLVTQDGTAIAALDAPLVPILQAQGLTVILGEDVTATAADADPTVLVVISETANSTDVNANFRDVDEAVVCMEGLIWDDMDISPAGIAVTDTDLQIVTGAHPIAAGLAGVVDFMITDPGSGSFHTGPAASATIVAARVSNAAEAVIFAFDQGAIMENGFAAPARRVGFGADVDGGVGANGQLDTDGLTMFDAAVAWALN